jgi:hypothetical protein
MKKLVLVPYITFFLKKFQILLQKCNLIFNVKILIDFKQKQTHLALTDTLYTALNNVRAYLFHLSANSLP